MRYDRCCVCVFLRQRFFAGLFLFGATMAQSHHHSPTLTPLFANTYLSPRPPNLPTFPLHFFSAPSAPLRFNLVRFSLPETVFPPSRFFGRKSPSLFFSYCSELFRGSQGASLFFSRRSKLLPAPHASEGCAVPYLPCFQFFPANIASRSYLFSFHIIPNSLSTPQNLSPIFSSKSKLLLPKHGGGGCTICYRTARMSSRPQVDRSSFSHSSRIPSKATGPSSRREKGCFPPLHGAQDTGHKPTFPPFAIHLFTSSTNHAHALK